jgi:hypothetical protein
VRDQYELFIGERTGRQTPPAWPVGGRTPRGSRPNQEARRLTELAYPIKLEDVDLAEYAAVFYPGGHGPMEDLATNKRSAQILKALA